MRLIFKRLKIGTNAAENVAAPPMSRCDDHHLFPEIGINKVLTI